MNFTKKLRSTENIWVNFLEKKILWWNLINLRIDSKMVCWVFLKKRLLLSKLLNYKPLYLMLNLLVLLMLKSKNNLSRKKNMERKVKSITNNFKLSTKPLERFLKILMLDTKPSKLKEMKSNQKLKLEKNNTLLLSRTY